MMRHLKNSLKMIDVANEGLKKFILSYFLIVIFTNYALFIHIKDASNEYSINSKADNDLLAIPSSGKDSNPQLLQNNYQSQNEGTVKAEDEHQIPQDSTPDKNSGAVAQKQFSGSAYRDGTYTGSNADAYYGNVKVRAMIQDGKIAKVEFLDYPSDRKKSVKINTAAMPKLKVEAISSQSADVDIVSGATLTSEAFRESLASALAQAKN